MGVLLPKGILRKYFCMQMSLIIGFFWRQVSGQSSTKLYGYEVEDRKKAVLCFIWWIAAVDKSKAFNEMQQQISHQP